MILRRLTTTLYRSDTCYLEWNKTKGWLRIVVCVGGFVWLVGSGKEIGEIFQYSSSQAGIQTRNLLVVSVCLERVRQTHVGWCALFATTVYSNLVRSNAKKCAE
jgi:hypothetical protein